MKCLTAITAILLLGSNQLFAQNASDTDVLLGAAAGGVIGSTIGQGDGKKIATVLGALIGAEMARGAAEARADTYQPPIRDWRQRRHVHRNPDQLELECRRHIPSIYWENVGAASAWVRGCVRRELQIQTELEAQAYRDGLNDY